MHEPPGARKNPGDGIGGGAAIRQRRLLDAIDRK
jgi:hypothetical protein